MSILNKPTLLALSTLMAGGSAGAAGLDAVGGVDCSVDWASEQALEQAVLAADGAADECGVSVLEMLREKGLLDRDWHAVGSAGTQCVGGGGDR